MWKKCAFWMVALNLLVAVGMWAYDCSIPWVISVFGGLCISECVAKLTFHLFFSNLDDYLDALHFRFKPDFFSWIDGNLWEDRKATWKMRLYHLLVLLAGGGAGYLLYCFLENTW